jgi:hypothetical protein
VADEDGDSLHAGDQGVEFALAGSAEVVAQQQVLRRVARERQFRRQQQVAPWSRARAAKSRMRARLAAKSPTVTLIWAIAIFTLKGR